MRAIFRVYATASVFLVACGYSLSQTNVTGVVVNREGEPIEGVVCSLTGFGGQIHYSGGISQYRTDKAGRFAISLPRADPLVDLQFDHGAYAPVFLYKVRPTESPVHVAMNKGKLLKGRIVERTNDVSAPIPRALVELQMPQEDAWYQRPNYTDQNGEFQFRISEPPHKSPWMLYFAGKRFKIDYHQVRPETFITLKADGTMTLGAEPGGPTNGSQPIRSETNSTSPAAGSPR